jgi:hypothetical protein
VHPYPRESSFPIRAISICITLSLSGAALCWRPDDDRHRPADRRWACGIERRWMHQADRTSSAIVAGHAQQSRIEAGQEQRHRAKGHSLVLAAALKAWSR